MKCNTWDFYSRLCFAKPLFHFCLRKISTSKIFYLHLMEEKCTDPRGYLPRSDRWGEKAWLKLDFKLRFLYNTSAACTYFPHNSLSFLSYFLFISTLAHSSFFSGMLPNQFCNNVLEFTRPSFYLKSLLLSQLMLNNEAVNPVFYTDPSVAILSNSSSSASELL